MRSAAGHSAVDSLLLPHAVLAWAQARQTPEPMDNDTRQDEHGHVQKHRARSRPRAAGMRSGSSPRLAALGNDTTRPRTGSSAGAQAYDRQRWPIEPAPRHKRGPGSTTGQRPIGRTVISGSLSNLAQQPGTALHKQPGTALRVQYGAHNQEHTHTQPQRPYCARRV